MGDRVDARASLAVVLLTLIVLIYAAVGPKGKEPMLLAIGVLLALVVSTFAVPQGTGRDDVVIHCKKPPKWQPPAQLTAPPAVAVGAATTSSRLAAASVAVANAHASAVGASAVDVDDGAYPQVAGEIPDDDQEQGGMYEDLIDQPGDTMSEEAANIAQIAVSIEKSLYSGTCPTYVDAPAATTQLYQDLIRSGTQRNVNEQLAAMRVRREEDPTEFYNRRTRLEQSLAQDLITYDRANNWLKDTHLEMLNPLDAAQQIAESREAAAAAAAQDAQGLHIGSVYAKPAEYREPIDIVPPPFRGNGRV